MDALSDGEQTVICGIMQHIEEAGVHSGDSMAVLPPYLLSMNQLEDIKQYTQQLAQALNVIGLINIQFAILFDTLYVLEVNPRASRTIPFVSKALGTPIAKLAVKVMAGQKLSQLGVSFNERPGYVAVKESVFPFERFDSVDIYLRPEMRSTGEVMGIAPTFSEAVMKAFHSSGITPPESGTVFLSVNDNDKPRIVPIAASLEKMNYHLVATQGTADYLKDRGIGVKEVLKASEGRPNVVDDIKNKNIDLIINTPLGRRARSDEFEIGWAATKYRVPVITTLSAAEAIVRGLKMNRQQEMTYSCLQEYHQK